MTVEHQWQESRNGSIQTTLFPSIPQHPTPSARIQDAVLLPGHHLDNGPRLFNPLSSRILRINQRFDNHINFNKVTT